MNPLLAQLSHDPFLKVANLIRSNVDRITLEWVAEIRHAMPQMEDLTFDELKDSTPKILHAIADALASNDPEVIGELVKRAPAQGLSRFVLHFEVAEVMQEDRLLRSIVVRFVEENLGRRMHIPEAAALHTVVDVMLQGSIIAFTDQQKAQLRSAAETELKFISYLSHDLSNNLNSVTTSLDVLEAKLKKAGEHSDLETTLRTAQELIHSTVSGMRQMLEHEKLRTSGTTATFSTVNLHSLAKGVSGQLSPAAIAKGVEIRIDVPLRTFVESDGELLSIVMQNLVGNGLKFSSNGVVRIGFDKLDTNYCVLWVSDEGPGIAPDKLENIFQAFKRGDVHGQQGVGLGLAIASQAAKLLGAELTVDTQLGEGSKFKLVIPMNSCGGENKKLVDRSLNN